MNPLASQPTTSDELQLPLAHRRLMSEYTTLTRDVSDVLKAAQYDAHRLRRQLAALVSYDMAFTHHSPNLVPTVRQHIQEGLINMRLRLKVAILAADKPPRVRPIVQPRARIFTGRKGRPKKQINVTLLKALHQQHRGSCTKIAQDMCAHPKLIRRHLLALGLEQPGEAPFQSYVDDNGQQRHLHVITRPLPTMITDEDLDREVMSILSNRPSYGRGMVRGALAAKQIYVTDPRITESLLRVRGPAPPFRRRKIVRTAYRCAGANAMWHNDGNHKLIRWKIVIHGFYDGHSRVVTNIRASGNNKQHTVLLVFFGAVHEWGVPDQCRGDHGIENVMVAQWMFNYRGLAAYLFGPSTANTRAERPNVEINRVVTYPWQAFFDDLELHFGLDISKDWHLGLLHLIFLPDINRDLKAWANDWNHHQIEFKNVRKRSSPMRMWTSSQAQDGLRGFEPVDMDTPLFTDPHSVIPNFGISDEMLDTMRSRRHGDKWVVDVENVPESMAYVEVDAPKEPFPEQLRQDFIAELSAYVDLTSSNGQVRRNKWYYGLQIATRYRQNAGLRL
ncbi:hypothetical protein VNI00_018688 [Paramarasmius palmivorus]|uniref:Integrase core domain-containing protein n=1 Tax=Paramarasmius palmivorus TaxID=297713 RepID=A0AAW0AUE4_9AGAR